MQKIVETSSVLVYTESVKAKSLTGFDSPDNRRTHRHLSQFGGFFASIAQHCFSLGGDVREASRLPVAYYRSVNPHIAALFAFDSALGGLSILNRSQAMQNHSSVVQFYFESHEVRALTIDGNPWFVAKDVCEYFGDTNYRRSVSRLDDDEKGVSQIGTQGGGQQMTIVNESGLYSLLFWMQPDKATGKLPQDEIDRRKALIKKFRKWVTAEVLPTIRKTGSYTIPGNGGRRSDIFHHRGPLSDSGLDIRYTMDLTKIVLNPTAANLRMLNRVSGLPVDDLMPQPAAMVNKASQQDLFDRFAAAMIRRDITGQVRFALVYAAFLGWCSANADDAHIPSKKALSSWLHDEGYIRRKPSGVATIYGLRLREV